MIVWVVKKETYGHQKESNFLHLSLWCAPDNAKSYEGASHIKISISVHYFLAYALSYEHKWSDLGSKISKRSEIICETAQNASVTKQSKQRTVASAAKL